MNDHPRKKVLIFDACFVLFTQDKKQVQNFEFEHTFSFKIDGKKLIEKFVQETNMHSVAIVETMMLVHPIAF